MLEDIDETDLMNRPRMAEAPEPVLAMVCACAALAYATERKAILRDVEQCTIHRYATRRSASKNPVTIAMI